MNALTNHFQKNILSKLFYTLNCNITLYSCTFCKLYFFLHAACSNHSLACHEANLNYSWVGGCKGWTVQAGIVKRRWPGKFGLICLSWVCGSFCWAKSSHLRDYVPRLMESRWRSERMKRRKGEMDRGMEKVMQMGVNVCADVEWGEVMLRERQTTEENCMCVELGGVHVWAGDVLRWGEHCLRRLEWTLMWGSSFQ